MFFLQSITITVLIILLLLCGIFAFPLGQLVTETVKGGHGIFNVCNDLVRTVHMEVRQCSVVGSQHCTGIRMVEKMSSYLVSAGRQICGMSFC